MVLRYLSGYIEFNNNKKTGEEEKEEEIRKIVSILEECKFLQSFIDLASKKEFQLRKIHLKNIFCYCLKILNFLLQNDNQLKFSKLLLKIFKEQPQSYKFLQFLEKGALEVISTIDSQDHFEQINSALSEMRLCIDLPPQELFEQTYLTLTYLCKHEPFTEYLRNQQSAFVDIDFLDKVFNILFFIFNLNSDQTQVYVFLFSFAEKLVLVRFVRPNRFQIFFRQC